MTLVIWRFIHYQIRGAGHMKIYSNKYEVANRENRPSEREANRRTTTLSQSESAHINISTLRQMAGATKRILLLFTFDIESILNNWSDRNSEVTWRHFIQHTERSQHTHTLAFLCCIGHWQFVAEKCFFRSLRLFSVLLFTSKVLLTLSLSLTHSCDYWLIDLCYSSLRFCLHSLPLLLSLNTHMIHTQAERQR